MKSFPRILVAMTTFTLLGGGATAAENPSTHVPAQGPRTMVVAGQRDAFRAYCTTG